MFLSASDFRPYVGHRCGLEWSTRNGSPCGHVQHDGRSHTVSRREASESSNSSADGGKDEFQKMRTKRSAVEAIPYPLGQERILRRSAIGP